MAPLQLLAVIVAGWMSREQQQVIEYLREENRVLREKLGKKRVLLKDDQRAGLRRRRRSWDAVGVHYSAQIQVALCQEFGFAGDGSFVARIWHACDGLRR